VQAQILLFVNRICLHPSVYCFENASLYLIYRVILLAIPSTPNRAGHVYGSTYGTMMQKLLSRT